MFPYDFFQHFKTRKIRRKILIPPPPPLLCIISFDTGSFLKHNTKRFPCQIFRGCGSIDFRRKILIASSLIHRVSRYWKLSETQNRNFTLRNFRQSETKLLSTEILDTPTLLCITFFDTGIFLKHNTKGFLCQSFRHCEAKKFRRKILTTLLISIVFRCRNFSQTHHRSVPLRLLSALQDKKNSTEDFDTPPPLLCIFSFDTGSFLKHNTKRFSCQIFRGCASINFRRKILIDSSLIHRVSRYWKLSETQHRNFPLRNFRHPETKILSTENLDTPLLCITFFDTGFFPKHNTKGFLCQSFRHCETKHF